MFQPVEPEGSTLLEDSTFGSQQAAPLAGGYGGAQQPDGYNGGFNDIVEEGPATPLGDSGEFSPFAAGTFTAGETGAFIPVGNTEMFSPVQGAQDDLFIDDADDSSVDLMPTVGDFNAPASIDIPESRGRRFMDNMGDLFHHKKKDKDDERQSSATDWLGVDQDYQATEAGRDIGSWENFSEDDGKGKNADDEWRGGASAYPAMDERGYEDVRDDVDARAKRDLLNKEVWFVALGASGVGHTGMEEFLAAHARDLKGALIVNLECVGAGEICYLEEEGQGKSFQSDYRLQTLIRKEARDADGTVEIETLRGHDTDATPALAANVRAITLMGFDHKAPVAWRRKTDRSDIIEPSRLELTSYIVSKIVWNG